MPRDNSKRLAFLLEHYYRARDPRRPPCERCQRLAVQTGVQRELRRRALIRAEIKQLAMVEPAEPKRGDKRAAVLAVLADRTSARLSYRQIAKRAGVSHQYVDKVIRQFCPQAVDREVTVTRSGKTYRQRISNAPHLSTNDQASGIDAKIRVWPQHIVAQARGRKPKGNSAEGTKICTPARGSFLPLTPQKAPFATCATKEDA